jgi:hypothetical protein
MAPPPSDDYLLDDGLRRIPHRRVPPTGSSELTSQILGRMTWSALFAVRALPQPAAAPGDQSWQGSWHDLQQRADTNAT